MDAHAIRLAIAQMQGLAGAVADDPDGTKWRSEFNRFLDEVLRSDKGDREVRAGSMVLLLYGASVLTSYSIALASEALGWTPEETLQKLGEAINEDLDRRDPARLPR